MHIKLKRNPFNYRRDLPHIQKSDKAHFITFTTYRRWELPSFARDLAMEALLFHDTTKMDVHAAVVMPDHVHAIVLLTDYLPCGLPSVIGSFKAATTRLLRETHPLLRGPVWQRSFHDRVLRDERALVAARRYVELNPLREGGADPTAL